MEYLYVLSESEKNTLEHNRRLDAIRAFSAEKRKNCVHSWKYDGHSHNDDCYVCTICGETEYS